MKSNSFCVPFYKLEPAAIEELHKIHPGALPISVEYVVAGPGWGAGQVVIWWVPGTGLDPDLANETQAGAVSQRQISGEVAGVKAAPAGEAE